jgi:hypothetical protein
LKTARRCREERVGIIVTAKREFTWTDIGGIGCNRERSKGRTESGIRGPSVVGFKFPIIVFDGGGVMIIANVGIVFCILVLAFFDTGDCSAIVPKSRCPREMSAISGAREEGLSLSERRGSKRGSIESGASDGFVGITSKVGLNCFGTFVVHSFGIGPVHDILDSVTNFLEVAFARIDG